jgi:hypothetical protein
LWDAADLAGFLELAGVHDARSLGFAAAERAIALADGLYYPVGAGNEAPARRLSSEREYCERLRARFEVAPDGHCTTVPLNKHITVIAGCTDAVIDQLMAQLRGTNRQVVVAPEPAQLDGRTADDYVLYHYLEDLHEKHQAQGQLLRRTAEMWPTIICARSSLEQFKQALQSGDRDAFYTVGGCGIRMDLFLRLVNYVVDAPAVGRS